MKIIIGDRGSGKTSRLIMESYYSRATIITPTTLDRENTLLRANEMVVTIPIPLTIRELMSMEPHARKRQFSDNGIIIDDLDRLLYELFSFLPINAISITNGGIADVLFISDSLNNMEG